MAEKIEIGTPGIKKALRKYEASSAIAEFVWNGFDAGANVVNIDYTANEIGFISELLISDNGSGISLLELGKKFKPFLYSSRVPDPGAVSPGPSATHGKNGVGRLTFFKFAVAAEWTTVYQSGPDEFRQYKIEVQADSLNTFSANQEQETSGPTGTTVRFVNLSELNASQFPAVKDYLMREFAWFLELGSPFPRTILINGEPLNYEPLVGDRDSLMISMNSRTFDVQYVRWDDRLHDEYSRYYFIGSDNRERGKKHTTLNNKGDAFFHSVYVHSDYFDSYEYEDMMPEADGDGDQPSLLASYEHEPTFRDILRELDDYLRKKRSPFLRKQAIKFVNGMDTEGLLPKFKADTWDQYRKRELEAVLVDLYQAEPRIFTNLNDQQKQTMTSLFNLVMDSSERDCLLDVLAQVVSLDSTARTELAAILQATHLSNVIATMKMIEDRFTAVDELKKMVFNSAFGANERDHLQTHIERHYWLFGEQYHLVTAAEPDFEQALRRYLYILRGEESRAVIDHPDKNKEMDVFAVRWLPGINRLDNIVLELKHPRVQLGSKELEQVKRYMGVILDTPTFNASNMYWSFYLIGCDYDRYIERELENAKVHGESHLVYSVANYRIHVLKWSEVIADFELRHNFILDRLKLERAKLATNAESADAILVNGYGNAAMVSASTSPIGVTSV